MTSTQRSSGNVPLTRNARTASIWCATRQVDNQKNKKFFLPGVMPGIFMQPPAASFYKILLVSQCPDSTVPVCSCNSQYNLRLPLSAFFCLIFSAIIHFTFYDSPKLFHRTNVNTSADS